MVECGYLLLPQDALALGEPGARRYSTIDLNNKNSLRQLCNQPITQE